MDFQIRLAGKEDFDDVCRLMCQLFNPEYNAPVTLMEDIYLANLSDDKKAYYLTESSGEVNGLCSITYDLRLSTLGKVMVIDEMVVDEKLRGMGIGAALVNGMMQVAKENGCAGIELSSSLQREGAHRFYEKHGFEKTGYRFNLDI